MISLARRGGLTLVELLVVLTILALVAGAALLRDGQSVARARLEWAASQWTAADEALRRLAAQSQSAGALRLELPSGLVTRSLACRPDADRAENLGSTARVRRLLSASREITRGPATIRFQPNGASESYAVQLATSDTNQTWLLFAGRTGQVTRFKEGSDVQKLLDALRADGNHTD